MLIGFANFSFNKLLYSKKKEEGRLYSGKIWHGQTLQWKRKWNDPGAAMEKDGTTQVLLWKKMERPGVAVERRWDDLVLQRKRRWNDQVLQCKKNIE